MNCKQCGALLRPNAKFCGGCGCPVDNNGAAENTEKKILPKQESYRPRSREENVSSKQESYRPADRERRSVPRQEGYRPGNREENTASKQNEYIPRRNSSSHGGDNQNYETGGSDTKKIRKYFLSQSLIPILVIILGFLIMAVLGTQRNGGIFIGIGFIVVCVGIVLKFIPNFSGEDEVDRAVNRQIKILKKRGMQKLNLIQEQVDLIDPIVLVGVGASPDSSFDAARIAIQAKKSKKFKGIFRIFNVFTLFFHRKSKGTEDDPVVAMRIGSDDNLRSMLLEVSVYMFSEEQILMYCGDVDISTGLVYSERTTECFYKDIEGMDFSQSLYKGFSQKHKRYINKIMENFTLYLGGCNFSASMNSEMNNSKMDNQFSAMRNLIRDKKNS